MPVVFSATHTQAPNSAIVNDMRRVSGAQGKVDFRLDVPADAVGISVTVSQFRAHEDF